MKLAFSQPRVAFIVDYSNFLDRLYGFPLSNSKQLISECLYIYYFIYYYLLKYLVMQVTELFLIIQKIQRA